MPLELIISVVKMSVSYQNVIIQPLISLTSPRETNVDTIFFPSMRKATKKRSAGSTEKLLHGDVMISDDTVSRSVHSLTTAVLSRVKPNNRQIDPGHFYMDLFVSNKEIRDYCDHKHVTGITTRKLPARQNTAHVLQHVTIISGNMSGSKTQIKKGRETGSLRGKSQSGKQAFLSVRTTRDKKSGVTLEPDKVNTAVHDLRSAKLTPKEALPRHAVNGKEVSKSTAVKPEEKKSTPNSLPHVDQSLNQTLLHVTEKSSREGPRTRRLSPRSLLDQISEESSPKTPRRGMNGTKPIGLGTKVSTPVDRTKSPSKVSPNVSSTRMKKNDKSRGAAAGLEDRVQEMALPKVTINEVLQSWNIGPQRTRSSSLAGKDPMEFLRRDRSLSDPKNRPTSYEDLRSCRYLRTDKDDQHLHGRICSCNSCEHGEGLRNTPYLNS